MAGFPVALHEHRRRAADLRVQPVPAPPCIGFAQHRGRHVVAQQPLRPRRQCRFDLLQQVDLDLDFEFGCLGEANCPFDTTAQRDMIVLDQDSIIEPHAVIGGTAHAGCIFLDDPEAGNRLAGVEQGASGSGDLVRIFVGERGYA